MTISKQILGNHSYQVFLKLHCLLIVVFLGISLLLMGIVPGIHLQYKWWYLFSVLIYFNKLIKKQPTWRRLRKKCSLYIWETPRKTKGSYWVELFFCWSFEICQLHMLSSFIQQHFSPYSKVNSMEKILKYRLAYIEPCETSMMELFCEYRWLLLVVHYFPENAPSYLFQRALNISLKSIGYSNCNVLYAL